MVHIKRVELSHFKSFGGTTEVPILPGFTVISGPNGSGKSNILDALLFGLGLATSRGMRAERLPDLVNHNQSNNRKTAETSVSVTFDVSDLADLSVLSSTVNETNNGHSANGNGYYTGQLENGNGHHNGHLGNGNGHQNGYFQTDEERPQINTKHLITGKEWTVTRRLRVTKGGSYSSTYYINGEVCTATELHEQLNRLRIYPEGYNVVLQGDVTRIITMNAKERREIIDELAGVAEFDRKITQTKQTLDSVREREERCRIIEQELIRTRDRLAADRIKAEKYQKLKVKIQQKQQWEVVLIWRSLLEKQKQLQVQIEGADTKATQLGEQLNTLDTEIQQGIAELERLNRRVKALGEDEQLSAASQLATQKAKRQQLQQRHQELATTAQQNRDGITRNQREIEQYQQSLSQLSREQANLENQILPTLIEERNQVRDSLENSREQAQIIGSASEAWMQEQTVLSRQITAIQETLNPQRTEQAQLQERQRQLAGKLGQQTPLLQVTEEELKAKQVEADVLFTQVGTGEKQVQTLAQQLAIAEHDRTIQQDTQKRLEKEQRDKQRQLDKLEATAQAQQEAQGTYATKIIIQGNLDGVHGLVAQLGQVEPRYQLALETAAGGRLGHIVVEDDGVAATGIELLKRKQAGRATFLPLNKIKFPRLIDTVSLRQGRGFIDLAVNLIDCQLRYHKVFAYVFGNTVVFTTLEDARPYLGKHRIVTLGGEILEVTGAMTGGSKPHRNSLHFGTATAEESQELELLRTRLAEIESMLVKQEQLITQKSAQITELSQQLTEARQQGREQQLCYSQLQRDIERLTRQKEQVNAQLTQDSQERDRVQQRLQVLGAEIPIQESRLQQEQQRLTELEESYTHEEWQQIQAVIKVQETHLQEREQALRQGEGKSKDVCNQIQRLEEKVQESNRRLQSDQKQQLNIAQQLENVKKELLVIEQKIKETEVTLVQLSSQLEESKQERDRAEEKLRLQQEERQQKFWRKQKLEETQQERKEALVILQAQIVIQQAELPDPLPEMPALGEEETKENFTSIQQELEQLQQQIRTAQKRLEAMEPVNMLALEEYEKTQERLEELSSKLATLEQERTEVLLRIETFTTLRFRAFKESFDAVNENFIKIFATLSEGDGHLQLENPENPFEGGLNLVAHPKGKPVQRLSSMSGGEKSLTALGFIFALQRYRPSPFYAFDEVDMFLDGANVERLSKMIKQEAQQAQFIVVSLRRPMIEASERTIGVTQARGAYTQVLGIKL